jgi:hypothetical protein
VPTTRIDTPSGAVSVEYTLPDGHAPGGAPALVLAHGAGSDMRYPPLERLAHAVARAGFACCRFNFAYREAGRRLPDRLPALVACYRAVAEHVATDRALAPPWVALGGRSLGGRVASHLVASGHPAAGLVFLAFPLHPAGRPDTARAAHLESLAVPMLFVQGTRDALATWPLLEPLVRALPSAALHAVEDADHALAVPKRRRQPDAVEAEVARAVTAWLAALAR